MVHIFQEQSDDWNQAYGAGWPSGGTECLFSFLLVFIMSRFSNALTSSGLLQNVQYGHYKPFSL